MSLLLKMPSEDRQRRPSARVPVIWATADRRDSEPVDAMLARLLTPALPCPTSAPPPLAT